MANVTPEISEDKSKISQLPGHWMAALHGLLSSPWQGGQFFGEKGMFMKPLNLGNLLRKSTYTFVDLHRLYIHIYIYTSTVYHIWLLRIDVLTHVCLGKGAFLLRISKNDF